MTGHDDELAPILPEDDGSASGSAFWADTEEDVADGSRDDLAGGSDAEEEALDAPVETAEDTAALARVYAALLARAGETQVELRLDATRRACELLGDIHTAAPAIMVTGTNGKTSTVRMVDTLLSAHNLRVGRFTSPHLTRVTERIGVDGHDVHAATFARVYDEIEPFLEMIDAALADEGRPGLTFFEALTVLALAVFADAPVDVMVLEVGMGGEWDSTNVVDARVCGFTAVGLDHQAYLGDTVEEIARTKAGILDRTVDPTPEPEPLAIIADQPADGVLAVLADEVSRRSINAWTEGQGYGVVDRTLAVDGQMVSLRGIGGDYPDLFLPLHGAHQAHNAATAVALTEAFLTGGDRPLAEDAVGEAFAAMTSPGRLEVLKAEPTILVDGAHNPDGARALAEAMDEAFDLTDVTAVLGMFADKDPHGVLEHVHRFADRVIVTQTLSDRAMDPEDLAAAAAEWFDEDDVIVRPTVKDALMTALDLADTAEASAGERARAGIAVTGSLLTAAEARVLLGRGGIA
ncbi:bifunctional folylpolyglutamate synthase/dihydrofolate synthase [Brevibacterium yomogidense]|uniref:tetrahydrofolate synthase n=1 Tax=Brevibacterium yomogidense TaxID=946573 RepID=A0A1X6XB13_9MICO|nr:folylpolyglutamate synthase/dihydrofolate synthase family protein [Brevibacterium yomogidense]SLM96329.1 Dihydrofolate synthase @ Folylpolyglutamate synthase [Brevibacterium yomogidense]